MKSSRFIIRIVVILCITLSYSCTKDTSYKYNPDEGRIGKKPDTPVPLGCIRGYFGKEYKIFTQNTEVVQPVDSFSNIYFYGNCMGSMNQINLIRSDSAYAAAIYIMGYSLDSLPSQLPVPEEFGKYVDIQFYKLWDFQGDTLNYDRQYGGADFYGKTLLVTDHTNDVLTGTFEGFLYSPVYGVLHISDGEFKIKIFRKDMSCPDKGGGDL